MTYNIMHWIPSTAKSRNVTPRNCPLIKIIVVVIVVVIIKVRKRIIVVVVVVVVVMMPHLLEVAFLGNTAIRFDVISRSMCSKG